VVREIGISEARKRFASLIRDIEAHPEDIYLIKVRNKVIAELGAPPKDRPQDNPSARILAAVLRAEKRSPRRRRPKKALSANYKDKLYG